MSFTAYLEAVYEQLVTATGYPRTFSAFTIEFDLDLMYLDYNEKRIDEYAA